MKRIKKIDRKTIFGIIVGLLIGAISVYAATTHYQSDQVLYVRNGKEEVLTNTINEIYNFFDQGTATANDIRAGKTALVKGKLITGTAEIDESPYIYEATLYCGWWSSYNETYWGNWSGSMTITDEKGTVVATSSVGTRRDKMYSFTQSASESKSVRFEVPRASVEKKTYTISLSCGWWTNSENTFWGNWSGSVTVNDVSKADIESIIAISVGTRRDQIYSFSPASASGQTTSTFMNK